MPIYAPRTETVKKQEEIAKRETELLLGIKKNLYADKILKLVDKYRKAQLSLIKARIHQFKENNFQGKPNNVTIQKLEDLAIQWTNKTSDDIISEIQKIKKP
jgi:hypothetical protein